MGALEAFRARLDDEWLAPYCAMRGYEPRGFDRSSIDLLEERDAGDFLHACDTGLVTHAAGVFRAPRSEVKEFLFWEHARGVVPRRLTLSHPGSGAPLVLEAPVPRDLAALFEAAGVKT